MNIEYRIFKGESKFVKFYSCEIPTLTENKGFFLFVHWFSNVVSEDTLVILLKMEDDSVDSDSEDTFLYKCKVCMVCKSKIVNDGFKEYGDNDTLDSELKSQIPSGLVCLDTFLKGISILCDTLNVEPKFASYEEWSEVEGMEDFVSIVCCAECYELFGNIVSLHELITTTQESLRVDVHKIKHYILQSQQSATEYSVSACLKFRNHILQESQNSCTETGSTSIPRTKAPNSKCNRTLHKTETVPDFSNISVKLEPLEVSENECDENASALDSDDNQVEEEAEIDKVPDLIESTHEISEKASRVGEKSLKSKMLSKTPNAKTCQQGRPRAGIRDEFKELKSGKVECLACRTKISNRADVMKGHKRTCNKKLHPNHISSTSPEIMATPKSRSQGRPRDRVRDEFKKLVSGKVQCLSCFSKVSNRTDVMKGHKRICRKISKKISLNTEDTAEHEKEQGCDDDSNEMSHVGLGKGTEQLECKLKQSQGRPRDRIRDEFKELTSGKAQCLSCFSKVSNRADVMKGHKRVCVGNVDFNSDASIVREDKSNNDEQSKKNMANVGISEAQSSKERSMQGRPRDHIRKEFRVLESGKAECLACFTKVSNRTDVMKGHKRICVGNVDFNSDACIVSEDKSNNDEQCKENVANVGICEAQTSKERNMQGRPRDHIRKEFRVLESGKVECLACFTKVSNRADVMKGHKRICKVNGRKHSGFSSFAEEENVKRICMRRPKLNEKQYTNLVKKRGRPCKLNKSTTPPESWRRPPIFVIDNTRQVFMFLNVKFQIDHSNFVCKHPECSYSIPIQGYFADQITYNNMRLHIRDFHRFRRKVVDQTRKRYHCCCHCDMQFTTGKELLAHRKSLHSDAVMPLILCEICGDIVSCEMLSGHVFMHKSEDEKSSTLKLEPEKLYIRKIINKISSYPCNQCNKVFRTKSQQQVHKTSHIPVELRRQIICDICGTRLSSFASLGKHRKLIHFRAEMPTPFVCSICGKTYLKSEKSRYHAHLNSHTGERPFQCSECGKRFCSKRSLWIHEKTHEDAPVQCEFCPKWYKNSIYMKRHQRIHHAVFMPKSFQNYSSEQREAFIGPKLMHPCEPCGRVFQYKSLLVKHLKDKHKLCLETNEDYPSQLTLEDYQTRLVIADSLYSRLH